MVDGQMSWTGGVDSGRVSTMASEAVPDGLKRNQLAFLTNGTVRGGGISQRTGFKPLVQGAVWPGVFQCAYLYNPITAELPYIVASIGGRIYRINVGTDNSVVDLSAAFGLTNPATEPLGFMVQGEEFLIIQAGDYTTLPLFWDGALLRRSVGFLGVGNPGNELPAAGPMDYYMGRLWYAYGRQYIAGDIVGNASGTAPYQLRDSILKNTENPLSLAGDAFIVPSNAGNIRMLKHTAELDTALGQGRLLIGTTQAIYRLNVPVTRTDWIAASNANLPLQTVAQIRFGPVGDRSAVVVNGDLFYQTLEPAIRSLTYAIRYFQQWGNVPISRNENRVLRFNDRALLRYSSGIEFQNRLLQTALPYQTSVGVAHQGIIPLDFDLISSLEEKLPPAWEGLLEGVQVLQLLESDFGGLQRAFSMIVSQLSGEIEVWELTSTDRFDQQVNNDGNRVTWAIETPSYTWGNPMALKQLDGMELWIDKMLGTVQFLVEYRVDQNPCWLPWHAWKECTAKDCREDPDALTCDIDYPVTPYCESFKATMSLPAPPSRCIFESGRPSNQGYSFQIRVTIKGWCRVRGILVYALPRQQQPFHNLVC